MNGCLNQSILSNPQPTQCHLYLFYYDLWTSISKNLQHSVNMKRTGYDNLQILVKTVLKEKYFT